MSVSACFTPSPGCIPGSDHDILINVLAEIHSNAWRTSSFTDFREFGFKRHPLAPCLDITYEGDKLQATKLQLNELIIVEENDMLIANIEDKFLDMASRVKKYKLGTGNASLFSIPCQPCYYDRQKANAHIRKLLQAEATVTIKATMIHLPRLILLLMTSHFTTTGRNTQKQENEMLPKTSMTSQGKTPLG